MSEQKDENHYESPFNRPVTKLTYNYYHRLVKGSGLEHALLVLSEELRQMGQEVEIVYGPRIWSEPTEEEHEVELWEHSKGEYRRNHPESET